MADTAEEVMVRAALKTAAVRGSMTHDTSQIEMRHIGHSGHGFIYNPRVENLLVLGGILVRMHTIPGTPNVLCKPASKAACEALKKA